MIHDHTSNVYVDKERILLLPVTKLSRIREPVMGMMGSGWDFAIDDWV